MKKAVTHVRLYPSTHKKLKIMAAKKGISIAHLVDEFINPKIPTHKEIVEMQLNQASLQSRIGNDADYIG